MPDTEINQIRDRVLAAIKQKDIDALTAVIQQCEQGGEKAPQELIDQIVQEVTRYQKSCLVFNNTYHDVAEYVKNAARYIFEKEKFSTIKLFILLNAAHSFLDLTKDQRSIGSGKADNAFEEAIGGIIAKWVKRGVYPVKAMRDAYYKGHERSQRSSNFFPLNTISFVETELKWLFEGKKQQDSVWRKVDKTIQRELKNIFSKALFSACENDFSEAISPLIAAGADVNAIQIVKKDTQLPWIDYYVQSTPLMFACWFGHMKSVEVLLECKSIDLQMGYFLEDSFLPSDQDKEKRGYQAPFLFACKMGYPLVIALFLSRPDVDELLDQLPENFSADPNSEIKRMLDVPMNFKKAKKILEQQDFMQQEIHITDSFTQFLALNPQSFFSWIENLFLNFDSQNLYGFAQRHFLSYIILCLPLHIILRPPHMQEFSELCYTLAAHFYPINPILAYLFFDKAKENDTSEAWMERCLLASMREASYVDGKRSVGDFDSIKWLKAIVKSELMKLYLRYTYLISNPENLANSLQQHAQQGTLAFSAVIYALFEEEPVFMVRVIVEFIFECIIYQFNNYSSMKEVGPLEYDEVLLLICNIEKYVQDKKQDQVKIISSPEIHELVSAIDKELLQDEKRVRWSAFGPRSYDSFFSIATEQQAVKRWLKQEQSASAAATPLI